MKTRSLRDIRIKYIFTFIIGLIGFLIVLYFSLIYSFPSPSYDQEPSEISPSPITISFTIIIIPFIIFMILFIGGLSVSYTRTQRKYSHQPRKDFKKRPSISISYAKNHQIIMDVKSSEEILNAVQNSSKLLHIIDDEKLNQEINLTIMTEDFIKKVEDIYWEDEEQKIKFIKEMLSLTPEEREEIIEYMLEKSKKTEIS